MAEICFDKTTFYLFLFCGLAVIISVLLYIHVRQLESVKDSFNAKLKYLHQQTQQTRQDQSQSHSAFADANATGSAIGLELGPGPKPIQIQPAEIIQQDVERMVNPFIPPMQRNPYSIAGMALTAPVMTNVPTHGEYGPFQQVGYLQNAGNIDHAMPLMGRRIYSNKYEYYTFHHNNPTIKIPIKVKGDQEIYDDITINVPGYAGQFKVKIYELDAPRYIPY